MSVENETTNTVLVTGFGPFGEHKINASWESVKLLPSLNIDEEFGVKLIVEEIPVTYSYVSEKIPVLWKAHKPMLVVHVGVSSIASGLTLELKAHRSGYCREDVAGELPPRNECSCGRADVIKPVFDVDDVCRELEKAKIAVPVCCSSNAGRFLCEFIYYTSLNIDNLRTIFIHVPELDNPYPATDLAKGIKAVLGVLIQEIRSWNEKHPNDVCCERIA
ncbi:pyroglutamyl-peptidase 1 [Periplaneta americana]|uniref:pyroglutamyl-peptidase 1 n=1 Tax=Periplaneta americana TaxID=6978 RepID=UPI0037E83778